MLTLLLVVGVMFLNKTTPKTVAAFTSNNRILLRRTTRCVDNGRSRRRYATLAASVTGIAWEAESSPTVSLYTKAGCTLCDEAKAILETIRETSPHSLELVDITDTDKVDWWNRYKYDIPVLHIDGAYWAKHRITADLARDALSTAERCRRDNEPFPASAGQPNAAKFEK